MKTYRTTTGALKRKPRLHLTPRTARQYGQRHGNSILSDTQVQVVLASNDSALDLAQRFCVTEGNIYLIRRGVAWPHLADAEVGREFERYDNGDAPMARAA